MTTAADYLVGNRVYNGGTNNPTSGTVNPTGYIQRGLSQRRSGLAAVALRHLGQPGTFPGQGQGIPNPGIQPQSSVTSGSHTVTTSPTGRLILTPNANPATQPGNVLPYDEATGAQQVTATKSYSDQLDAINAARHILQNKIAGQAHTIDANAPGDYRHILDSYAGRGMAYSSGYGTAFGNEQDAIANQRATLQQQLQEGLAGYDQQQQTANDNYQMLLAQLAGQSASNSAANGNANMLSGDVTKKVTTPTTVKAPTKSVPVKAPIKKPIVKPKLTPAKTKAVAKKIVKKGK